MEVHQLKEKLGNTEELNYHGPPRKEEDIRNSIKGKE